MYRKKWLRWSSLVVIVGSFFALSVSEKLAADTFTSNFLQQKRPLQLTQIPLIMVPGTGGTTERFDGLITSLQTTNVLKVTVHKDEQVTMTGKLTNKSNRPIIVIAFEDASDEALVEQGKWFQIGLQAVVARYAFSEYTFLGHSNGGLILTQYLEDYYTKKDPTILRAMTLGTPYNDMPERYNEQKMTFDTPKEYSPQLTNYLANQARIPSIDVYNIIGDTGEATDEVVTMTSVLSGRLVYQDKGAHQEKIITDDAEHSALVENVEVISLIHTFLWQENK